ncbi:MAG TPA: hypothetical protein VKE74_16590, partial [Gemmataceae bacterium]|nr:hypothetical protein [Gemmataceae bacterium]
MPDEQDHPVLRSLRKLTGSGGAGGATDAQLLDRFVTGRDAEAFAELVRRHGPMVYGVCRRRLHNHAD